MRKLRAALGTLFAQTENRCLICGRDIFDKVLGFCDDCRQFVTLNNGATCTKCGTPIVGTGDLCENCIATPPHFDRAYSMYIFDGGIVKNIYSIKFGNFAAALKVYAQQLVYLVRANNIHFDVVTFAPMTAAKVAKRGYNQAQVLAEYLCETLDRQCMSYELIKTRDTVAQEQLTRTERQTNLTGAFSVRTKGAFKDKAVLLIDDVKTTGSTLSECARVLKKDGATAVVCLTIASRLFQANFEVN
jgi:ComF family protein